MAIEVVKIYKTGESCNACGYRGAPLVEVVYAVRPSSTHSFRLCELCRAHLKRQL